MTEAASTAAAGGEPLVLEMRRICKAFTRPGAAPLPVLVDVDLQLHEGQIVGLLGRSGTGKSTLLRIAGGLMQPDSGEVRYGGVALTGPSAGIAVVFQTFALYPWLTVLQNVELGLDALGLPGAERRRRACAIIELIGLNGFESAFPRELSGGMRQRVGVARALVSEPLLLLMDEPFSALDVLTAETLRTDFLDLWTSHRLPTRAVLLVTHNVEEAVLMCDRLVVLGGHPARVAAEIPVGLAQPRDRLDPAFHAIVADVYAALTAGPSAAVAAHPTATIGLGLVVPEVSVSRLSGLLDTLSAAPYLGRARLSQLASRLALEVRQLLAVTAAAQLLEFAVLEEDSIKLTAAGRVFAQSAGRERRLLFREHLLRFVPLAAHIRQVLQERDDHRAPRERFELELQDHLHPHDAERTLRAAIGWGRYAGLYSYDDATRAFELR